MTLTFDLLILKVVSGSRVTWATSVPILVFLGFSVLDLSPMYATDTQTDRRQTASSLNAPAYQGRGITRWMRDRQVEDAVLTATVSPQTDDNENDE